VLVGRRDGLPLGAVLPPPAPGLRVPEAGDPERRSSLPGRAGGGLGRLRGPVLAVAPAAAGALLVLPVAAVLADHAVSVP